MNETAEEEPQPDEFADAYPYLDRDYIHYRQTFGRDPGAKVIGLLADGGILVLRNCDAVELAFLQLDRLEPTLRPIDRMLEDAHCKRMRVLGAKCWKNDEAFAVHEAFEGDKSYREDVLIAGYPAAGGVWVLQAKPAAAAQAGVGRIKNARDMEERCRLIEKLGGTFHEDLKKATPLLFEDRIRSPSGGYYCGDVLSYEHMQDLWLLMSNVQLATPVEICRTQHTS
ncbi:hypothetical protein CCHR01_16834 [Colletotrichum chrysophilum]|uniref:Uncharacterized protein n=1 Tax=Colletotrichum chrysophilum TaxID=1836956 RepID=A0AAD9ED39_9PEZI|nr:hypothetical protein CCHR01_16834 [Colletotrichum chrysophilum]